jgi:signal transduction histidine kinase
VIEWVGTGTDVHAQKLAERALAAANARLQEAGVELERSNQRLQDQAAELEAANDELRAAAAELEARTADAERAAADALRERDAAAAANTAKAQFLATMSHELRTPLNAIGGYVQLLDMGLHGPVTGEQQGALGRVTRAQRHLLGLINDILNYAKLESGRVEYDVQPVDAREVVAEVTALVEPQLAARPLALHVALPDALPPVWADREKLRQILVNLLSNALKFTEPGGRVLVDLGTRREGRGGAGARRPMPRSSCA